MQMLSLQFYFKSSVFRFLHWSVGLTVYLNPLNSVTSRNGTPWLYDVSQQVRGKNLISFLSLENITLVWKEGFHTYGSMYKREDLIPLTFCVVCHKITYSDSSVLHMHMNVLQERLEKTKKTKKTKTKTKTKTLRPHEILKSVHKMRKHS